jgi:hypothetical protein
MNIKNTLYFVTILGLLFSCDSNSLAPKPQPTELEKARIEPMMPACMIAVTRMPGSTDAPLANAFSLLGQYVEKSGELMTSAGEVKKEWKLLSEEDPRRVNMEFSIDETKYSCDVVLTDKWVIEEVRRNDEVVFNLAEDKLIQEEEERIKEEARLSKIRNWEELGYSNVAYKYYKKRHTESQELSFNEQYAKFNCPNSGPKFQIDGVMFGKRDVVAEIKLKDEELQIVEDLVIDQYGYVGYEKETEYSFGIDSDEYTSNFILRYARDIDYIVIDGYRYNFDDVSQVKCLEEYGY